MDKRKILNKINHSPLLLRVQTYFVFTFIFFLSDPNEWYIIHELVQYTEQYYHLQLQNSKKMIQRFKFILMTRFPNPSQMSIPPPCNSSWIVLTMAPHSGCHHPWIGCLQMGQKGRPISIHPWTHSSWKAWRQIRTAHSSPDPICFLQMLHSNSALNACLPGHCGWQPGQGAKNTSLSDIVDLIIDWFDVWFDKRLVWQRIWIN